jgi:membrane-bound lytic murein transglycosylase B
VCFSFLFSHEALFDSEGFHQFISSYDKEQREAISSLLGSYGYKKKVIELMTKPAEALTWPRYKALLINDKRIAQGKAFMAEHQKTLLSLYHEHGVPPRVVTALIGIESSYGQNTGSFLVGEALKTLSFTKDYRRAAFFQKELKIFLDKVLQGELSYDQKGSYAGAFGMTQFIPSSYQSYAKSFEPEAKSPNLNTFNDALKSTAAYLDRFGWKKDQAIASCVESSLSVLHTLEVASKNNPKPSHQCQLLPSTVIKTEENFALLDLEDEQGLRWLGFQNFYALTRYNHSTNYAMAIFQLSEQFKERECELYGQSF